MFEIMEDKSTTARVTGAGSTPTPSVPRKRKPKAATAATGAAVSKGSLPPTAQPEAAPFSRPPPSPPLQAATPHAGDEASRPVAEAPAKSPMARLRVVTEPEAAPASEPSPSPPPQAAAARQPDDAAQPAPTDAYPANIDVEALAMNMARLMEEGRRAATAFLMPREGGDHRTAHTEDILDAVRTLGQIAEYWYADPQRIVEMQARLGKSFLDLFTSTSRRLAGDPAAPAASPDPRDKRFSDPEWSSNHYFDFIKQSYLILADWANYLVERAENVDPAVRQRAEFYVRQIVNAAAPSNFLFTNPVLLRTTLNRSAENL